MTPQSSLMVVAPIATGQELGLRDLLAAMNRGPGRVEPNNSVVPFEQFETLHFARFIVLDDVTTGDVAVYNVTPGNYPLYLVFLADFDGDYDTFLEALVRRAGSGLRRIFSHCESFTEKTDLLRWMRAREHRSAASYVNWRGRTVRQCREERALRQAVVSCLQTTPELQNHSPLDLREHLHRYVREEQKAGRLNLTPEQPASLAWRLRSVLHAVVAGAGIGIVGLVWGVVVLILLRRRERSDPVIAPRPKPEHVAKLAEIEDYGVTNQFSAMGSLKPGLFRQWTLRFVLWVIDYTARHIYTKGRLARVHTIHFARWVFLDGGKRMIFASNYDGSLESYMDDFINKVFFGLNVSFSNGVGYPSTRWLLLDGARDEQKFKYYLRRHQLPTQVWYNAHAGSTATDLDRNSRIRKGLESALMTEAQAREWAALL